MSPVNAAGEEVDLDSVFSRTPANFELISCELEEKKEKFGLMPDPQLKSLYRVTMMVDGREAFLILAKERWPDD